MIIHSFIRNLNTFLHNWPQQSIKDEPMLFNCDLAHAHVLGGPIVRDFISKIPLDWYEEPLVIDTRVHMLMPGWYPCIPGWHHDDVPRTRMDGQPNYGEQQDRAAHIMALCNGQICPTQFAIGSQDFSEPDMGTTIYKEWDAVLNHSLRNGSKLELHSIQDKQLVMFDDRTWHRGSPATGSGWRWFGRISRYWDANGNCISRRNPRTNEVRKQVQVYIDPINKGW